MSCMTGSLKLLSGWLSIRRYQMRQLGWTVFVLMVIVIQLSAISDNLFEGFYWFWLPASLVVCNDTFAYFAGKKFGRKFIKRPFLRISPNKTWEGFIGALICTLIWCVLQRQKSSFLSFGHRVYCVSLATLRGLSVRSQFFSWVLTNFKYMMCPVGDLDCELPEYFIEREYIVRVPALVAQVFGGAPDAAGADLLPLHNSKHTSVATSS